MATAHLKKAAEEAAFQYEKIYESVFVAVMAVDIVPGAIGTVVILLIPLSPIFGFHCTVGVVAAAK